MPGLILAMEDIKMKDTLVPTYEKTIYFVYYPLGWFGLSWLVLLILAGLTCVSVVSCCIGCRLAGLNSPRQDSLALFHVSAHLPAGKPKFVPMPSN